MEKKYLIDDLRKRRRNAIRTDIRLATKVMLKFNNRVVLPKFSQCSSSAVSFKEKKKNEKKREKKKAKTHHVTLGKLQSHPEWLHSQTEVPFFGLQFYT